MTTSGSTFRISESISLELPFVVFGTVARSLQAGRYQRGRTYKVAKIGGSGVSRRAAFKIKVFPPLRSSCSQQGHWQWHWRSTVRGSTLMSTKRTETSGRDRRLKSEPASRIKKVLILTFCNLMCWTYAEQMFISFSVMQTITGSQRQSQYVS